ncbi:DUF1329 domain-containing protein [Pseudomonas sp. R5(2019)]|uniref:DUF1329 domain-containing protein n=1 Tax=Pseudomonas sp. R5(2019) TaxID=2697566 RepID=UPI001412F715|nr:DUF1329 domain-containing protein [Pseudomonas sp. R5(2019)]NBA98294.1 DUF1329 domain-containing protein [Pseudomonas sp. R5(2019)]
MRFKQALLGMTVVMPMLGQTAFAGVSEEQAKRLGQELTCVGAEKAGNAAGTIPAFTGKYQGKVPGWNHVLHSGGQPVDPYADEKPVLVITAANAKDYTEHLTPGQLAMFKQYPQTYTMNIYPGHRDYRYSDVVCERARWNATHAQLANDGMGVDGVGQVPFPIPQNAMELLWNHQLPARAWTEDAVRDLASVLPSGDIGWGRTYTRGFAPSNDPHNTPKTEAGIQAYSWTQTLLPARESGTSTVSQEPYNFKTHSRQAWSYNPGTRRVRQLPGYGYDQPMTGSNGTMIIDEDRLFNGSPERYDWEMLGKREIYVPANAYKVNGGDVKYKDLLTPNHPNPAYMRYELRRVWVLQATLKPGFRHLYGKRVLFLDEDTWHAVLGDAYDTRGQLWKHGVTNYYYHPDSNAWHSGVAFFQDLSTGQYMGYNMTNESRKGPILNQGKFNAQMYTPDALRAAGR